jgi:NAD(P)-dependent dehydrogenase (short-subunit alcohol dehydrogenase family)
MQLGVNHLGHFALTAELLPALLRGTGARVVSVTSTGRHVGTTVDPDNPHLVGRYDSWRAYGQSKLANAHFAIELNRRFREAGVPAKSIVVHPGFTNTDLQARSVRETGGGRSQRFYRAAVLRVGMSPAQGALSLLRAATDPGVVGGASAGTPADVRARARPGCDGQALGSLRARNRHYVRREACVTRARPG